MAEVVQGSSTVSPAQGPKKFGTFNGVYIPSVLTILGVIMYLRMGWVLGSVGLLGTIAIVVLASSITFLTGLSISATSTNMKVGGGGAYYMISRSLGIEAGAAVGIPLYFAQSLGISFYLAGFTESLLPFFPGVDPFQISCISLVVVAGLALFSANLALRTQLFVFIVIVVSLVSFFGGGEPNLEAVSNNDWVESVGFWAVFAVFFPAVTGIEAGLSMSGDLKDPTRALPFGTLGAVLTGLAVYLAIPIFLTIVVDDTQTLLNEPMIMKHVAFNGHLVTLGLWGATLSSALGAMLGAPRTLQALARDHVIWRKLGTGHGDDDSPRIATAFTFCIALGGVLLGDLNAIAPVLSMFFLTSYGVLNLTAGLESMINNPSWRPKFRFPWALSMIGGAGCFSAMFMINAGATIVSICFSFGMYFYMQKRRIAPRWDDMRRGILMFLARISIGQLARLKENSKSWRPNILVLSGTPTKRWYLIELADAISHGMGFVTVATIIPLGSSAVNRMRQSQKVIEDFLAKRHIPALVRISAAEDVISGAISLVRDYGLGPIYPNTIILGETEQEENFVEFAEMLIRIFQSGRNIVIVRQRDHRSATGEDGREIDEEHLYHGAPVEEAHLTARRRLKNLIKRREKNGDDDSRDSNDQGTVDPAGTDAKRRRSRIDIWWGRERRNAGFSLAMGYMLQSSPEWSGASLNLMSVATPDVDKDVAAAKLESLLTGGRLEADAKVFEVDPEKSDVFTTIRQQSAPADLVFIGMLAPDLERFQVEPEQYTEEYAAYYHHLLESTRGFPECAIVLVAEDVDFHKIFSD